MKKVHINASREYDVVIGAGLLGSVGNCIKELGKVKKAAIVSDTNVAPIYLDRVKSSIEAQGIDTVSFIMQAGEASKCGATFLELLNFLADERLSRTDVLVALGGGVVGDMTGFAASCYLRGVRFIALPTTLLAAVDSSVGGKTAIDLNAGKNLAGTFYQPARVICDTDTLSTLPEKIFSDGCAEVIKYGCICDEELFCALMQRDIREQLEDVIARCVEIKSEIVSEDEFDTGRRQLLNFGHTPAHAIEALSRFEISHGSAVAAGMAIMTRAAADMGICDKKEADRMVRILEKYALPTGTDYSAKQLANIAKSDKKIAQGSINVVLPKKLGDCFLYNIDVDELEGIFKRGLK